MQTILLNSNNKTLLVAATLSLLAHCGLLLWLFDVRFVPEIVRQTERALFIQLQKAPNSTARQTNHNATLAQPAQAMQKKHPARPSNDSSRQSEPKAPESRQEQPVQSPAKKSRTEATAKNDTIPHSTSGLAIYDSLSSIAEQYATPEADEGLKSDLLFDSELADTLREKDKENQDREKLQDIQKALNEHRYKEFRAIGGQRMIRIEGKCFSRPEDDPLDEFDNPILMGLGDCSKKQKIEFRSYAPHIIKQREKLR